MNRQKVTCPLTYFAIGAQAHRKPAIPLDLAPNKQVLLQGWFKIYNKRQNNTLKPMGEFSCKGKPWVCIDI